MVCFCSEIQCTVQKKKDLNEASTPKEESCLLMKVVEAATEYCSQAQQKMNVVHSVGRA